MKRLLVLAYDFPPYVSVGGLRPYAWYKYLKEYGVEPVVVTRQWGNKYGNELDYIAPGESNETIVEENEYGTIIRTPYKPNLANRLMLKYGKSKFSLLRKLVSIWYEFMQFLFFVGPKSGLYKGAKEYLKHNKVDAIIATVDPYILLRYASVLSKKYEVPWVADYRDPWIQNKNMSKIARSWCKYLEKKYTANASVAITVSEFCKVQIETNVHKPFHVIPNGYNPDAIDAVSDIKQGADSLRFAFVGTIYNWHPLESVLQCFSHFADSNINPKFELNFYGVSNADDIVCLVDKYPNLKKHVKVFPRMRNEQLLAELAKHNIMLLLNYYSYMGTKIYDYIGIRRQIMLCYSNDEEANALKAKYYPTDEIKGLSSHLQEDLIAETNSGIIVKNKEELARILPEIYGEFVKTGFVECKSNGFENYSRKGQTKQLAEIIKEL